MLLKNTLSSLQIVTFFVKGYYMKIETFTLLTDAVEGDVGGSEQLIDETAGSVGTIQTYSAAVKGSPAAVTVTIEGSLDGTNWGELASHTFTAGDISNSCALFHIMNRPVVFLRSIVDTLSGGTTPTMTVIGRIS